MKKLFKITCPAAAQQSGFIIQLLHSVSKRRYRKSTNHLPSIELDLVMRRESRYPQCAHSNNERPQIVVVKRGPAMNGFHVTSEQFLADSQGKTFADVVVDVSCDFDAVLRFFSDEGRQLRMEDAETHHDRPPLAGVIRELEDLQEVDSFLRSLHPSRSQRFRQAVGVVVRIVMEQRGWRKTGRKGAMGVRSRHRFETPIHNQGGLSFWFARAERYEQIAGVPFVKVRVRHRLFLSQQQLEIDSN